MIEIEYKGGNSVVITTKKVTLVVDPHLSMIGLKDLRTNDMVLLATEQRFLLPAPEARVVIDSPGEYEVGDSTIYGIAVQRHIDHEADDKKTTMYCIEIGDIRIALLGNIAAKGLSDQMEDIGVVDVLIIPVGGGGYTLDATSATHIVRQIDPKVVIPVHYADTSIQYEVPQDTLLTFTDELGAPVESMAKYKLKSAASLPQTTTVVEITRS